MSGDVHRAWNHVHSARARVCVCVCVCVCVYVAERICSMSCQKIMVNMLPLALGLQLLQDPPVFGHATCNHQAPDTRHQPSTLTVDLGTRARTRRYKTICRRQTHADRECTLN
jgi:hypothetical protein